MIFSGNFSRLPVFTLFSRPSATRFPAKIRRFLQKNNDEISCSFPSPQTNKESDANAANTPQNIAILRGTPTAAHSAQQEAESP